MEDQLPFVSSMERIWSAMKSAIDGGVSSRSAQTLHELGRDFVTHGARPALGAVEGDNADPGRILAFEQVADQRSAVGVGRVGLGPR
jgi:hypothetical protein